jgi:hypothetical protein
MLLLCYKIRIRMNHWRVSCCCVCAALAFGTPAASEAGSIYGSFRNGSIRSVADIPSRTDPRSDPRTEELRRAVKSDLSGIKSSKVFVAYPSTLHVQRLIVLLFLQLSSKRSLEQVTNLNV